MEGSQGKADILVAQTASNGISVGTGNGGTISNCRMASGTAKPEVRFVGSVRNRTFWAQSIFRKTTRRRQDTTGHEVF